MNVSMKPTVVAVADGRSCGDCSLCCKLLDIDEPEIEKPAHKWCTHCRPGKGGCTIYSARPPVCRNFACEWLINPELSDAWWPKRAKIVAWISTYANEISFKFDVDISTPDRWREAPYYADIKNIARSGLCGVRGLYFATYVRVGARSWQILPNKDVEIFADKPARVTFRTGEDEWEIIALADEEKGRGLIAAMDEMHAWVSTMTDQERLALFLETQSRLKGGAV
jgi:hypothetical protein